MSAPRRAGFTFVELVVTTAIFGTVLTGLVDTLRSAGSDAVLQETRGVLDEKAWRVTGDIARELRWAQTGTLLVTAADGSSRIEFRVPAAVAGDVVSWSSPIRYEYATSNVDANHDHAVNEGAIVRIQDGRTRVLCSDVPPGGFSAAVSGSSVTLTLHLQAVDSRRRAVSVQATRTVSARN
jgi:prepilin-type N-terminal cleavage/methylation domain-containing protein